MAGRRSTFGLDLDNELNRNRPSLGPVRLNALSKAAIGGAPPLAGGGGGGGGAGRPSLAPSAMPRPSMGRPSFAPAAAAAAGMGGGSTFAPRASDFALSMGTSLKYEDVHRPRTHHMADATGRWGCEGQSDRRGSIYRSLLNADGPRKDPRNIRDIKYQHDCIRSLIRFLADNGYDRPVSPKILSAPSVKDFTQIFHFLYHQLDPAYVFGTKYEEEIPLLIRNLGYVRVVHAPTCGLRDH
jgi:hypothetical protein